MFKREQMLDGMNRPYTQALFLELGYQDEALYTLKEVDHVYEGKKYPSIKKLYLEMTDPTEYKFATTYFLGWSHWLRLGENKAIRKHIDEWRDELEIKLRAEAVAQVMEQAKLGSFPASKWLADRGWANRGAGRPSKLEQEKHKKIQQTIDNEYGADVVRMFKP